MAKRLSSRGFINTAIYAMHIVEAHEREEVVRTDIANGVIYFLIDVINF